MSAEIETLLPSELMRGVERDSVERLAALGRVIATTSGTSLFRLGDAAENVYVILRGRVALMLPMQIRGVQQDVTIDEKGPGDMLGWSALVPPYRATLAARALIDSDLYIFPGPALTHALREQPATGLQLMSNVATVIGRRMHLVQAMWLRELQRAVLARYA